MDAINKFFQSIAPDGFRVEKYLQFLLIFVIGALIISVISRLIFGKRSTLSYAVSSAITILFIYALAIIMHCAGINWDVLSALPFVRLIGDYLYIMPIFDLGFGTICAEILDFVILAFLVNIASAILPKSEKMLLWYLLRILSVVFGMALYWVLMSVLPVDLGEIAPMVLLGVIIASMLLGGLKLLVGGALTIVNPLLGLLYTFFFANIVGKQLSRAMLTTAVLTGLVCLLNYLDITVIFVAGMALVAFIPIILIAMLLWFVIDKFL